MEMLICIMLSLAALCFASEEAQSNRITIEVSGSKYPGFLPQGFDQRNVKDIAGYFVAIEPESGCGDDVQIQHKQEHENTENKLVSYVDWFDGPGCNFNKMTENLRDANITDFVLLVSDESKDNVTESLSPDPSSFNFVLFTESEENVNKFKGRASTSNELVYIQVTVAKDNGDESTSIPMSSMAILFVTVAFVTLMTVSIGWLVFYYAQRCRQRNMRERLQSRLCMAATRAVGKLPTKTVPDAPKANKKSKKSSPSPDNDSMCSSCSSDDGDFCPVCLDLYKPREVIRILPCKHEFHKNCVDPWLFDHRTCPMCKLDILEHFGMLRGEQRATTPQRPPDNSDNNVSLRVDQEVQTDFINTSQHNVELERERAVQAYLIFGFDI